MKLDQPMGRSAGRSQLDVKTGSNTFEGSVPYWGAPMAQMHSCRNTEAKLGEINRVLAEDALLLQSVSDDAEMVHSSKRMCRDSLIGAPTRAVVQALSEQGKPAWAYYFTQTVDGDEATLGAFHAMEIRWVNFAARGSPNGSGLPQ